MFLLYIEFDINSLLSCGSLYHNKAIPLVLSSTRWYRLQPYIKYFIMYWYFYSFGDVIIIESKLPPKLLLSVLGYSSQRSTTDYKATNIVDGKLRYPNEWVVQRGSHNDTVGSWISLAVNNSTTTFVSKFIITPKYSNDYDIPRQVTVSFSDGTSQVLQFDCSVNSQTFFVNKVTSTAYFVMQSFCGINGWAYGWNYREPGFGEIEAFGATGISNSSF